MAKEKIIGQVEGYEPPSGRSLTLRIDDGGAQSYVEVDTSTLNLPTPEEVAAIAEAMAPPAITYKADMFRRMTDAEYATFEQLMGQQPKRKQKIFEHAQHLNHKDEDFAVLKGAMIQAYGEPRTKELLGIT